MEELELAEGVADLPAEEWNALVGEESPFLEWEWLASLERAGTVGEHTGWHPRPLVARRNGKLVAACPLYLKLHSEGEFVFDWSWADAADRAGSGFQPSIAATAMGPKISNDVSNSTWPAPVWSEYTWENPQTIPMRSASS